MKLPASNSVTKLPVGRPSSYRPERGARIADVMAKGFSLEAAAAERGIGPRTVFTWQNEHDEFRQSIEEGRIRALLWWEKRAIASAEGAPGNASIISLGLRNRSRSASGWVDKTAVEHSGVDGGPVQVRTTRKLDITGMSTAELDALERALTQTVLNLEQPQIEDESR